MYSLGYMESGYSKPPVCLIHWSIMSAEQLTTGPMQDRFFALAETITTEILGPDYAVRVDESPDQVAVRVGMRAPVIMPNPSELEISALYRRDAPAASFEGEWYKYILGGLLRYMGRKEVVAVYPGLVPVLPVAPEPRKADIKVTYSSPRLARRFESGE
jgi:hypothetical protein